jgi:hypothetical protein
VEQMKKVALMLLIVAVILQVAALIVVIQTKINNTAISLLAGSIILIDIGVIIGMEAKR